MLLVTRAIIQTKAIPVVSQTPNRRGTGGSGKAIISRTSKKAFSSSSFSLLFTDQQRMMIFPPSLRTTTTHLALLTATASSSLFASGFGVRHFHVHSLTLSSASAITTTTSRMMSGTTSNSNEKSKMDQSFKTWSFDEPCKTMAWSPLSDIELTATTATTAGSSSDDDDTDLIFVGVYAPKKQKEEDDDGKEKDDDDDDDEEMEPYLSDTVQSLDSKLGGVLTELLLENNKEFKNGAKAGTTLPTVRISNSDGGKTQRYIVIGLGTETSDENDDDKTTTVGNALGKALATHCDKEKQISSAKLVLPAVVKSSQQQQMFTDLSSTFYSTLYDDNRHRTKKSVKIAAKDVKTLSIETIGDEADDDAVLVSSWNDALLRGKKIAYGISMAKDVVNAPHNVLNSVSLADTAKRIADESTDGCLSCTILDKTECEKRGMGAYLGVARASETEPQFIHITYTPPSSSSTTASTTNKRVGIIGKGLLFDTGGYNIKTAGMELMKFDCGGAAAVLGAARAIGQLQPLGIECHFVVAACENMINEKGIVPSDILTASNGKTIEVLNTDAEGRLTLADALVFCDQELQCDSIIELSTLTGACMVALGQKVCGVWTQDDKLWDQISSAAKTTEEKSWRMPMEESYNEQLKSKVADLSNLGSRYGGAITAALFLQNFVSKKVPFAHIDIAGPVWDDKDGATGFGAKLATEWVVQQQQQDNE